jgi:hypothetical protein
MHDLASLWIGERLSAIELASLHSFVVQGHRMSVYSYAPIANLPSCVEALDANEILPSTSILYYRDRKKPSPALHANLFRYAMIARTPKVWVDLDIIALRPLTITTDYVLGYETPQSVNNAVLRLPAQSPTLRELLNFNADTRGIAPHITGFRRFRYYVKSLGRGHPIDRWAWGSTGPKALTLFLNRHDEMRYAQPISAYYPVAVADHAQLLEPGRLTEKDFGPETWCIHLWGSRIRDTMRRLYGGWPPAGSFLADAFERAKRAGVLL